MSAELLDSLAQVQELLAKAAPTKWRLYDERLRPNIAVRVMEIQQANGRPVIPWPGFDSCDQTKAQRRANARAIIAAVNFLRTHGPELMKMLEGKDD